MDVRGTVVTVDLDIQVPKNGGGAYPGSRLTYRDATGAMKEKAFHQNVFKFNAGLKAQLSNISAPGTEFVMSMEKEGEFWNVKSINPAGAVSAKPTNDTPATGKAAPASYTSPKSTYETPEERAKKQVYIVRQSSITAAIAYLKGQDSASVDDVLDLAKQFEQYVFGEGSSKQVALGTEDNFPGDEAEVY